jgi:hypothetical protein
MTFLAQQQLLPQPPTGTLPSSCIKAPKPKTMLHEYHESHRQYRSMELSDGLLVHLVSDVAVPAPSKV